MVPFPEPDGVTVHHPELLETVHAEFDVTVNGVVPAGAVTFWFEGVTVSVGDVPDCVTVTITFATPVPVAVIVATLEVNKVLAVTVATMAPSPLPVGVTVHQPALLDAAHAILEETAKFAFPAVALTF